MQPENTKNMDFCRRRQNKLKLLRSKNQWYMMIWPFIYMKSICWIVFWYSHALKTIHLMSFWRFTLEKIGISKIFENFQKLIFDHMFKITQKSYQWCSKLIFQYFSTIFIFPIFLHFFIFHVFLIFCMLWATHFNLVRRHCLHFWRFYIFSIFCPHTGIGHVTMPAQALAS